MENLASYLPRDRRFALYHRASLPERVSGAALFADIAGFTPATEAITRSFGPRRGAEELLLILNELYRALIDEVDRFGGSVIAFSGDAITCWFDALLTPAALDEGQWPEPREATPAEFEAAVARAAACALALQAAMTRHGHRELSGRLQLRLGLKVSIAVGAARRLLVGDPSIQQIEVLAGTTIARLGALATVTSVGEILLDARAGELLAATNWRQLPSGERCALLERLPSAVAATPWPELPEESFDQLMLRPWVLPPVYERLQNGQGAFLTELRHTISLFLRFAELDYHGDEAAGAKLDAFVRWVQQVLARHQGWLIQLSMGDKGSYLYATFGAPIAHGDDAANAASAALTLRTPPPGLAYAGPLQIGLSGGQSRVGAMGGTTRTYNVMGDATNVAARLMQAAAPGQVLMSANLVSAVGQRFTLEQLPPLMLKGKAERIPVVAVSLPRAPIMVEEPQHALPLIGRAAERATIAEAIEQARSAGRVLGISGEAGIGKSRLVAEAMRQARASGFTVLAGAGQATDPAPYAAWRPIWRLFFGLDPAAPPAAQVAALERAVAALQPALLPRLPLLGLALGLPLADNELTRSLQGEQRKEALESLLVECLQARLAGTAAPMLVVIEDAHWLDALARDLLVAIARAAADLPLLLLLAYRPPQPNEPQAGLLTGLRHGLELRLAELPDSEAAELIAQRAALAFGPEQALAAPLAAAIAAHAEGNPLFAEELINYLRDLGIPPDDPEALRSLELPGNLFNLILSRIDRLPLAQQTVLKVASVIGRIFPLAWLWGVHPDLGSEPEVRRALAALATLDVTPLYTPDPDLRYIFKHATTQEVAYATLPFAQRAALHDQFAAWLEAQPETAAQLDLLAYHYGRGTNRAKQREYFRKAGDAAAARNANAAAIDYYERLCALQPPEEQAATLLDLGRVYERTSDWATAQARCEAAIELATAHGQEHLKAWGVLGVGRLLRMRAQFDEAAIWLERANAAFIGLGDQAGASATLLELARFHFWRGDADLTQYFAEASLAMAGPTGDPALVREAYSHLSHAARMRRDFPLARSWLERSLELARAQGDRLSEATTLTNMAVGAFQQGHLDEALTLLNEALPVYQELGARYQYARASQLLALVQMGRGAPAEALRIHGRSLAMLRELGARAEVAEGLIGMMAAAHRLATGPNDLAFALRLAAAAQRLSAELERPIPSTLQPWIDALVAAANEALGPAADALWAEGAALPWEEAVSYALAGRPGG